jgi:hypothetical protein
VVSVGGFASLGMALQDYRGKLLKKTSSNYGPARDSNPQPPNFKPGALDTHPRRSVWMVNLFVHQEKETSEIRLQMFRLVMFSFIIFFFNQLSTVLL